MVDDVDIYIYIYYIRSNRIDPSRQAGRQVRRRQEGRKVYM